MVHLKDKSNEVVSGEVQEVLGGPLSPPWLALSPHATWPGTGGRPTPSSGQDEPGDSNTVWNIQALLSHVWPGHSSLCQTHAPGLFLPLLGAVMAGSPPLSLSATCD